MEMINGQQPVQNQPQPVQPVQPAQPIQPAPQNTGINKAFVVIAAVIIIAVLAGGIFAYKVYKNPKANQNTVTSSGSAFPNSSGVPAKNQGAVVNNTANDVSDTQINKDLQFIDNNLNSLDANASAADQGLNDQPVNLQ